MGYSVSSSAPEAVLSSSEAASVSEIVSASAAETAITDVSASREQKRTDNFLNFIKTS